jgi:DNA polymerase-3 subunit gamma/tau
VALLQTAPEAEVDADHADVLRNVACRMTPEDVQLFYQIGLHGRRDIALAPDARSGLEMTLLRMLAFRPAAPATGTRATGNAPAVRPAAPPTAGASAAARPAPAMETQPRSPVVVVSVPSPAPAVAHGDTWSETVAKLGLTGMTRELANHCTRDSHDDGVLRLTLDQTSAHLLNKEREAVFKQALVQHYGRAVDLRIAPGSPQAETPARERLRTQTERQQAAVDVIMNDPAVQALQENFNAKVDAGSIRPKT